MDTLSKNAPVPLYLQVKSQLEAEIRDGTYGQNDRLPSIYQPFLHLIKINSHR